MEDAAVVPGGEEEVAAARPLDRGARCSRRRPVTRTFLRQGPWPDSNLRSRRPAECGAPADGESRGRFSVKRPWQDSNLRSRRPAECGAPADGESRGRFSVKRPWQDSNLRSRRPAECGAPADGESRGPFSVKRPWQDSNLRSRLRRAVLYPLSYRGSWGAKEGYPSRPAGHESVRRYRRETGPPTPIPLVGDPRTARVDHRRRPPGARRRRRRQPARRRPHDGGGRASAQQGARGLRDQRRAPAGEEGGHQPAGLRRAGRRAAAERRRDRGRRHRGPGVPQHHGRGRRPGRGRAQTCVTAGAAYGRNDALAGERINVEFISANPTGPLHLGHTRWAAVGDALARVLDAAGAERGRGSSTSTTAGRRWTSSAPRSRPGRKGEPVPEDGYQGAYVDDARAAGARRGARASSTCPTRSGRSRSGRPATGSSSRSSRGRSTTFRTHFDVWFSERSLHDGRAPWPTAWRSCATRATCSTPTVRSGCAPPTSATTRTGCWSGPTAS